jgi:hypothetical protein
MTKFSALMTTACAAALLTGCAANQQFVHIPNSNARVEDPAKGRICVVRPSGMASASSMEIWDGKTHIGNTGASSYLFWERPEGEAIIEGKEENTSTVSLWVKSNKVYYIFQHLRMGWWAARNELEVIDEAKALPLIKKCKPPQPGTCKDHPECRGETPKT